MKRILSAALCLVILASTLSLTAFAETPIGYKVLVEVTGNGTVTPTAVKDVPAGTRVYLAVNPEAGYRLKEGSLKYSNLAVEKNSSGDYSFNMPTADVTVTATFEKIPVETTWDKILKTAKSLGDPLKSVGKTLLEFLKVFFGELVSGVKGAIGK